jgi:hypothetical protein
MKEITDRQKLIYNLYLKSYRKNNNQPYRTKKNFDDVLKDDNKMTQLIKLENIFKKYPALCQTHYFDAPYKIYNDEKKFYPLSFYSSQKGITTCINYIDLLRDSDPESQFEHFKESYKFIANFCTENRINLSEYTKYCSVAQNDCLTHLKQHKISWYLIFSIPNFYELLYNLPKDEFELYFGTKVSLSKLYDKYNSSSKTKQFLSNIQDKIATYVRKQLQISSDSVR